MRDYPTLALHLGWQTLPNTIGFRTKKTPKLNQNKLPTRKAEHTQAQEQNRKEKAMTDFVSVKHTRNCSKNLFSLTAWLKNPVPPALEVIM